MSNSLSKVSNIIYLDSPAGGGFSYSRNKSDYINYIYRLTICCAGLSQPCCRRLDKSLAMVARLDTHTSLDSLWSSSSGIESSQHQVITGNAAKPCSTIYCEQCQFIAKIHYL